MNNSLKFKSIFGFIAIVVVLLASGSTQNAHAQFGLFDTVWTINNLAENHTMFKSPNDSLLVIWTYEQPGNINRYRLFNTLTKVLIWDTTLYRARFILNDNHTMVTWDTNKIILRDLYTLEPISTAMVTEILPSNCLKQKIIISEVDTSVYYSTICSDLSIKASTYKVNYRTGQATITTDSLPYFAMTISEDGQYVAGVYYTGGTASNIPYNEVIEVRKISDYSLVFRESKYYCDYTSNFYPYSWVTNYKLKFSKDNHYIVLTKDKIYIYDLITGQKIFEKATIAKQSTFSNNNILFFLTRIIDDDKSEKIKACTFDCENDIYLERDFPDSTNQLIFHSDDLVFNNNYVLCHMLNKYNKLTNYYSGFADVALLSLNFDLTSIQPKIPESNGILYPNPTNKNITVKLTEEMQLQLKTILYDSNGKIVKEFNNDELENNGKSSNYNVTGIPTGTYFLRIFGKDYSKTYKVIINR